MTLLRNTDRQNEVDGHVSRHLFILLVGGSGTAMGRLLIGCYHNCAVQYDALGLFVEMLNSINTAVQLAEWLCADPAFDADLHRLRKTKNIMATTAGTKTRATGTTVGAAVAEASRWWRTSK